MPDEVSVNRRTTIYPTSSIGLQRPLMYGERKVELILAASADFIAETQPSFQYLPLAKKGLTRFINFGISSPRLTAGTNNWGFKQEGRVL